MTTKYADVDAPNGVNLVVLRGHLSSAPVCRQLPSGSVLVALEVTTSTADGAWSVPVAWFDPPVEVPFDTGDAVVVFGAVRRRFFRTPSGTQSRTEVLATEVVSATAGRKVQRLVNGLYKSLGPLGPQG